jgi:16S rRNA (cytidine1402-2'-O)-methyltransferase
VKKGVLYVVATPIGNLKDITFRAVEVLKSVALIAAEDTRHSHKLLSHYLVNTKMISYHAFNEKNRVPTLLEHLDAGEDVALISDAGTPLINDPGYVLVQKLHELGYKVIPIPGPCALIAALSTSGLPTEHFVFEGFLSSKPSTARQELQALKNETRTIIFYETPHRILQCVELMKEVFGDDRVMAIARELTKNFETIMCDTISNVQTRLIEDPNQQRGEFVVLVHGKIPEKKEAVERAEEILKILMSELSLKQAVSLSVKITGGSRKKLYELALKLSA